MRQRDLEPPAKLEFANRAFEDAIDPEQSPALIRTNPRGNSTATTDRGPKTMDQRP